MARGDGGKNVFTGDEDRWAWHDPLGRCCGRFGWRVHAWVMMGNHFHLLIETPEPNLVAGMKWFLGAGVSPESQALTRAPGDGGKVVFVNDQDRWAWHDLLGLR